MNPSSSLSIPNAPTYHWSWRYFWKGYRDYLRECTKNPQATYPGKKPPASGKSLLGAVLVTVFALFLVSVTLGMLAPSAARLTSGSGIDVLGTLGTGVVVLGMLGTFVLVPFLVGRKAYRFGHSMARRGWELEHGLRLPANFKVPA